MPAPNDLTPEEEAAFAAHGVQPAGQGSEPVRDEGAEQQIDDGQQQQHGDRTPVDDGQQQGQQEERQQEEGGEPKPGELGSRHRADGTFKNKDELEADRVALEQQGQSGKPSAAIKPPPGFVPHQALHEARQREVQARQQAQLAVTRMNALLNRQQNSGAAQPEMPDLNEDPVGYIQALETRLAAFEQQRAEENQYRQLDAQIEQDEEMFRAVVPDYDNASDHYVQSRAKELLAFHTPADAQRILTNEARQIAKQAWERGIPAAQMVYQLAQARGYAPGNTAADPLKAPIPPRPQNQNEHGQGRPSAQEVVAAARNGQATSRSLSGGAGGGAAKLNAEALLQMSDEEFEQYLGLGTKGANARFAAIG